MSISRMKVLSRLGYMPSFNYSNMSICEHCLYGKQTLSPHKGSSSRKSEPLQLVHSDVCGPMLIMSLGGAMYFVTFIDDFSQKVWAYPLKRKEQVLEVFQRFVTLVKTHTGKKLLSVYIRTMEENMCQKPFKTFVMQKGLEGSSLLPIIHPRMVSLRG